MKVITPPLWLVVIVTIGMLASGGSGLLITDALTSAAFNWSSELRVLAHSDGRVIYHNFTAYEDELGKTRFKFTKREWVAEPALIHAPVGFDLSSDLINEDLNKRGYTVNPVPTRQRSWSWRRSAPNCPVIIPYCYADPTSKSYLQTYMNQAIQRWIQPLGANAGVAFQPTYPDICLSAAVQGGNQAIPWTPDTDSVVIRYVPGNGGSSTTGYTRPDRHHHVLPSRHYVYFDPNVYSTTPDSEHQSAVGGLAHELGHVLGLQHEHQRPDAATHVHFNCEALDNYDEMEALLKARVTNWKGRRIYIDDVCEDAKLALSARNFLGAGKPFVAGDYVPFPANAPYYPSGAFDYQSLMLYDSFASMSDDAALEDIYPLTYYNGQTITAREYASAGDMAVVKSLYPDVSGE